VSWFLSSATCTQLGTFTHAAAAAAAVAVAVAFHGREYPLDWITRQMKKSGMVVTSAKKMPVLYAPHTVKRQVRYTVHRDERVIRHTFKCFFP